MTRRVRSIDSMSVEERAVVLALIRLQESRKAAPANEMSRAAREEDSRGSGSPPA